MISILQISLISLMSIFSPNPSVQDEWNSANDAISRMAPAFYDPSQYEWEIQNFQTTSEFPIDMQPACNFDGSKENCDLGYFPFAKVTYKNNPIYYAYIYLLPGFGDIRPNNKLLIVSDAFDPGDQDLIGQKRSLKNLATNPKYSSLVDLSPLSPRMNGYDEVFVDYSQGAGDIFINSGIFAKVTQILTNSSNDPAIVGGPSMGGIISRVAMLYLQKQNNSENSDLATSVFGYLSIDSPHQGAEINSWIQKGIYAAMNNVILGAIGADDAINSWKQLITPAAWQMLYLHYDPKTDNALNSSVHDAFYAKIKAIGNYNKNFKLASIAYSNFYDPIFKQSGNCGRTDNAAFTPGLTALTYRAYTSCYDNYQDMMPGSALDYISDYSKSKIQPYFTPVCYYMPTGASAASETCPSNWRTNGWRPWSGTFIPTSSAFDMNIPNQNLLKYLKNHTLPSGGFSYNEIIATTPFDYIGYMPARFSTYGGIQYPKYVHIVFEGDLMKEINSGLSFIEQDRKTAKAKISGKRIMPIINYLLQ